MMQLCSKDDTFLPSLTPPLLLIINIVNFTVIAPGFMSFSPNDVETIKCFGSVSQTV